MPSLQHPQPSLPSSLPALFPIGLSSRQRLKNPFSRTPAINCPARIHWISWERDGVQQILASCGPIYYSGQWKREETYSTGDCDRQDVRECVCEEGAEGSESPLLLPNLFRRKRWSLRRPSVCLAANRAGEAGVTGWQRRTKDQTGAVRQPVCEFSQSKRQFPKNGVIACLSCKN